MTSSAKEALLQLAAECERVVAPSREIDASIHAALGGDQRRRALATLGPFGPSYTSSLDAAMTLVPEGWDGALYLATDTHKPSVQLETPAMRSAFSMDYEGVNGTAETLALALCAAALRAQSESRP